MGAIFISSENCKTFDAHILMLNLTDKLDLQRCDKRVPLSDLSVYYTCKNIKKYRNNECKLSGATCDEDFELPNGSCYVWDIQDYFEYIIKTHETLADNPTVQEYANKFKIKSGCWLELLTPETKKLLRSTEEKITKDKTSVIRQEGESQDGFSRK